MKKRSIFILFLGFVTLNTDLYSMEKKQEPRKIEKNQVSKADYAKIIAAGFGIGFLGIAAITSFLHLNDRIKEDNISMIPLISLFVPSSWISRKFGMEDTQEFRDNTVKTIGSGSILMTAGLGLYLYKKISELRKKQNIQSQDRDRKIN